MSAKIVIINNIPVPHKVLQLDRLASILDGQLTVIYYRKILPYRKWLIPELKHNHIFSKDPFIFTRFNFYPSIIKYLIKTNPDIILAEGLSITIIISFLYAKFKKKKFILFTEYGPFSVKQRIGYIRRYLRKLVIPRCDATIGIGKKGYEFLSQYGAKQNSIFISSMAIKNSLYRSYYKSFEEKEFDLMFSGQFIDGKMPFFVIDILKELKNKNFDFNFLLLGSGPLEKKILQELNLHQIKYHYAGFIKQQDDLPRYYSNAKILLFPTKADTWGVVAQEALAAGTPVITCPNAGCADDLVVHNYNGFVLPLITHIWTEHIIELLTDKVKYKKFSENALKHVDNYSIEKSTQGLLDAINSCLTQT